MPQQVNVWLTIILCGIFLGIGIIVGISIIFCKLPNRNPDPHLSLLMDTKHYDHDHTCRGCGEEEVDIELVIQGGVNCHYCGNSIPLCSQCVINLRTDLNDIWSIKK